MDCQGPDSRRASLRSGVLIAVATIPFLAAIGFQAVERRPSIPKALTPRPSLVFDQYLINLGDLYNTPRAEVPFRFKNCGKGPVKITKLEPSCGCLNPRLEKRLFQPGDVGEFTLTIYTTREKPGPNEYSLTLEYEDSKPHAVTVAFKVNIQRQVTVQPSQLLVYQNGLRETEQTVIVTDMREKPFRVTGAHCKSGCVKVRLGEFTEDKENGRQTPVVVTVAAEVPEGGQDTTVLLFTDDAKYPSIRVPIMIRRLSTSAVHQASHQAAAAEHSK